HSFFFFFFQAEDGIRDLTVTGVQTCALPIYLLRVLAEPNVIAISGEQASFLAGGEFPIPVPQTNGTGNTITIEYKKFGVKLDFRSEERRVGKECRCRWETDQ